MPDLHLRLKYTNRCIVHNLAALIQICWSCVGVGVERVGRETSDVFFSTIYPANYCKIRIPSPPFSY